VATRVGSTRVESWLVSKLTAAFSDVYDGKTKLEMPLFQRGVVWSPPKQAELVRSLKQGFPVGSLLFYKKAANEDGIEVNLLIDGLQRTTAIRDYTDRPLSFMGLDDLDHVALPNLTEAYVDAAGERELSGSIEDAVADWMNSTETLRDEDGFDVYGLLKALNESLVPDNPVPVDDDLAGVIHALLKSIRDECDIAGIVVPVLFYEGSDSDLPDIFERINATGTKLSKYEIFAASWVNQDIDISNEKIREAVRKRYYALMTSKNISVNGVKADGTPEHMSLFDYLFGLGKYLSDEFPLLFGGTNDPTAMESVAFALATICHKLPLSQMHRLPEVMDKDANNRIKPDDFQDNLIEAAKFVSDTLAPYIDLKLNSESSATGGAHTDLQIASMVARAFCGTYVPGTWETREGAEADRALLCGCLPQHYLVDVLQQNWRGSGDSRLYRMVWDASEDDTGKLKVLSPARYYLREFSGEEFGRVLDQWFSDQVKLNQRSRSYVTAAARAFLKYVYSDKVTVKEEKKVTFELDHIFPVSRLVGPAKADEDGWPISAVANLALFDWQTNREKSRLDLVQYLDKVDEVDRPKKRKAVEKYLFLPAESAAIPRDEDDVDALTRDEYLAFLRLRFDVMRRLAFETLSIPLPKADLDHDVDSGSTA